MRRKRPEYSAHILENAVKQELFFDINNFEEPKKTTELVTLAHNIRNVLLMKKGTMPDSPNMGANLLSYQFSRFTRQFMNFLEKEVIDQIATFIGKNLVASVNFSKKIAGRGNANFIHLLVVLTPNAQNIMGAEALMFELLSRTDTLVFNKIEYR